MTTTVAAPAPTRRPVRRRIDWSSPVVYVIALAAIAVAIVPVIYVILGGFRSNGQLAAKPVGMPDPWIFENYANVLTSPEFWRQVFNSAMTAIFTTLGVVIIGVMAAYVLARYEFKGREALNTFFTLGLLFPLGVAILPLYFMVRNLGLLGSLWGLIIPQIAFSLPITIVILRPFLRAIPAELEDASALDGCSRVGFFWRILLPLSGPVLVTVGVLSFVMSWNAYLLPLLMLSNPQSYTLPLGVQFFSTAYSQDTAAVLAFTSLAMLPALIFFSLAQRRIVGGLTGAVKG